MFTVILLTDRAKARFDRWSVLFDPFVKEGRMVFCDWNQGHSVPSLAQAIPGLSEAITGRRDWRVVVVDTESTALEGPQATSPENPFDYVDRMQPDPFTGKPPHELSLRDSNHPPVRLAHMLLGYPDLGTQAFVADPSYLDGATGLRVYESDYVAGAVAAGRREDEARTRFRNSLVTQRDVQVHYREVPYSDEEQERHRQIAARYRVRQSRPNEVVFVGTREPVLLNPTNRLRMAWGEGAEDGPSRFVERNEYPPSCRFAVYDLRPRDHSGFELDEMRFWLSVLTLCASDFPPSSFQAERLYRIGVDLDDDVLASTLNGHLGRLAAAREQVDAQIKQPQRSNDGRLQEILKQRHVRISFDQLGGEELAVGTSGYGLASDKPKSEFLRWGASFLDLQGKTDTYVRKPRRVLARAVRDTRSQSQNFLYQDTTLTAIEQDELREELAKRTRRLTEPATHDILRKERLSKLLLEGDTKVKRAISERMRASTISIALLVVMGAWVLGLAPYLIKAAFVDASTFAESLIVALLAVAAVLAAALLVLIVMRQKLIGLINSLNSQLKSFVAGVNAGASEFAAYLSDLTTYMQGRAVLIASDRQRSRNTAYLYRLNDVRKRIADRMNAEKAIVLSVGKGIEIEPARDRVLDIERDGFDHLEEIFQLPVGQRQAALNDTGEEIPAPYDFVRRLSLKHVGIRERVSMTLADHGTDRERSSQR